MENTVTEKLAQSSVRTDRNLRQWVIEHDNSIVFNVLYIGLAIVLSIWLGLFWLVAVVGVHGILEIFRQYLLSKNLFYSLLEAFWELKLDLGLIVFAFWLAIYLDFIFGLAGLTAGARAAAQTGAQVARSGTRVAIWQRIIRGVFITLDDVGLAFKVFSRSGKQGNKSNGEPQKEAYVSDFTSWRGKYSRGDWFSLGFLAVSFVFILVAPLLTPYSPEQVVQAILRELKPF